MRAKLITTCVIGLLMLQNHVPAQQAPPSPSAERREITAGLRTRLYAEAADGTVPVAVLDWANLTTDGFKTLHERFTDGCALSTGPTTEAAEPPAIEWTIDARLVSATEDSATIDLRWRRAVSRDAVTLDSLEEEHRLVLEHGQWVTLDLVRPATQTANRSCRRLVLQIMFRVQVDAGTTDAALRYDMWLVHQQANARTTTERILTTAEQDTEVTYFFMPLEVDALAAPDTPRLFSEITGTLRGRARADGLIDLTLIAWRRVFNEGARNERDAYQIFRKMANGLMREMDTRGIVGSRGRMQMTVRPGETVEVALPPLTDRVDARVSPEVAARSSTAIRMTTTRVR